MTVPKASYNTQIGWGQTTEDLFTFGISQFGSSTDRFAASQWSGDFTGPYDDVSRDGREIAITRGRDNTLTNVQAGAINLTLRDAAGRYNPRNPASPIAAYLDTDVPIRTVATFQAVNYPLYYGFVTDIEADPSGRGLCTITGADFLDKMGRQSPIIPAGTPPAGATDGAILGAILDWFGWTDPALRSLGVGDTILAQWTRADGTRTALDLTTELLACERGIVFVTGAGAVKYLDRNSRYMLSSLGAIDKTLTAFPVSRSNQNITNQWTVQRTDMVTGANVGVPQIWPDPTLGNTPSQVKHGIVSQTLSTPFLNTDDQALNLAQYLVLRTGTTLAGVYEVPISIADIATFTQVLARDIGDRVTMTLQPRNMALFTADFFIESIAHTISTSGGQPRHTCVWRVSEIAVAPFRFGSSLMGGPAELWY